MIDNPIPYRPNAISPPGRTIAELLDERGITQRELALRTGRPYKTINEIVNGKAAITPDTAYQLELVLGVPASYWLRHEALFRSFLVQRQAEASYSTWSGWLAHLPIRELKKLGVLPDVPKNARNVGALVRAALEFFGVVSPAQWEVVYSQTNIRLRCTQLQASDSYAIATWLRLGELAAQTSIVGEYSPENLRAYLPRLRELTMLPSDGFQAPLKEALAEAGVVLCLIPAIHGARVSGAARWLGGRPVIQLSGLGKYNDRFWFTLFHEIGHILLHGARRHIYLDEWIDDDVAQEETEADRFAADSLIPPENQRELVSLSSADSVCAFAERISVHPGIVVGRLQHDGIIPYNHLNHLKVRYEIGHSEEYRTRAVQM